MSRGFKAWIMMLTVTAVVGGSGCKWGGNGCPIRVIGEFTTGASATAPCCDATIALEFAVRDDDLDVDLYVQNTPGAQTQVEAWLTLNTCERLFDPAANTPRCDVLIGPVSAGSVSERRDAPRGTLRIWVKQRTPVNTAVPYGVGSQLWGERCGPIGPS
jgi:hypothetical protein